MNEIESVASNIRQGITNFLVPLQTSRVIDRERFDSLMKAVDSLALQYKELELVSKSLLNELFITIKILRSEAPYFKDEEEVLLKMANNLELVFELILRGETLAQRLLNNPRKL